MKHSRSILGALLLCALCFSAFSAASASGSTLHVCTEEGLNQSTLERYTNGTCLVTDTITPGHFHTTEIANGTATKVTGEGEGNQELSATLSGVKFTIKCTGQMTTAGTGTNVEEGGVMKTKGAGIVIEYTGCTVTAPAEKGCKIKEGKIKTVALKSITVDEAGEVMKVKFEPESGTKFTTITVEGCSVSALNGEKPVEGTASGLVSKTDAGLLEFTSTSGSALTFGGQAATYTGKTRSVMEGTTLKLAEETP